MKNGGECVKVSKRICFRKKEGDERKKENLCVYVCVRMVCVWGEGKRAKQTEKRTS